MSSWQRILTKPFLVWNAHSVTLFYPIEKFKTKWAVLASFAGDFGHLRAHRLDYQPVSHIQ